MLSTTTGTVAMGYFLWALIHCMAGDFDGGVISFPIALCASIYGYGVCTSCSEFSTKWYRTTALCGFGAVALNYLIMAAIVQKDDGWLFLIYLLVGAGFWLIAIVCAFFVNHSREQNDDGGGAYKPIGNLV